MNNPEKPTQNTFGFARGTPINPTSSEIGSVPKKGVRGATREEAEGANEERLLGRIERTVIDIAKQHPIIVGSAAVTGIGGAIAGAVAIIEASQNNTPEIHRLIDSVPSSDSTITFENNTTKGIEPNITRVPREEIDRLYPTFGKFRNDSKETTIIIPPPNSEEKARTVIIREDGGILQLLYPLDLSESANPNAKAPFIKSIRGFSIDEALMKRGYDTITFPEVPDGTTIRAPTDGFLMTMRTDVPDNARPPNDGADTSDVLIDFIGQGYQYRIGIVGFTTAKGGKPGYEQTALVFKNLTDGSTKPSIELAENNQKLIGTYGTSIKRGEPILRVVKPDRSAPVQVALTVFSALKTIDNERARPIRNPSVQTSIELITAPDGTFILPQK